MQSFTLNTVGHRNMCPTLCPTTVTMHADITKIPYFSLTMWFRALLEYPGLAAVDANRISACPIISHIRSWPLSAQFPIHVALGDLVALSLWEWRVVAVFVVFKVLCDAVIVVSDVVLGDNLMNGRGRRATSVDHVFCPCILGTLSLAQTFQPLVTLPTAFRIMFLL